MAFCRDMGVRPMLEILENQRILNSHASGTGQRPVSRLSVETEPVITDLKMSGKKEASCAARITNQ
jgi:hypothetical protein